MKKLPILSIFSLLLIFLFSSNVSSQEAFEYHNNIKLNPVEMANSEFKLTYERFFSDHKYSVSLMPSLIYYRDGDEYEQGWQAQAQFRWYVLHLNEMNGTKFWFFQNVGIYGGVYGLYLDYEQRYNQYDWDPVSGQQIIKVNDQTITAGEGGVILGVQLDITKRFCLDLYFGGGLRTANVENSLEDAELYGGDRSYEGIKPTGGLQFGLYF